MNVQEMRGFLLGEYPNTKWSTRVAKMPDSQVLAIYKRMQTKEKK